MRRSTVVLAALLLALGVPALARAQDEGPARVLTLLTSADPSERARGAAAYQAHRARHPDADALPFDVGMAFYRRGELATAIPYLRDAASAAEKAYDRGGDLHASRSALVHYALAAALLGDGKHADAFDPAFVATERAPLEIDYAYLLGTVTWSAGYHSGQIDVQERVIRLAPSKATETLHLQLGVAYAIGAFYARATDALARGLRAFPASDALRQWRVVTRYAEEGWEGARAAWAETRPSPGTQPQRREVFEVIVLGLVELGERAERAGSSYSALSHYALAHAALGEMARGTGAPRAWLADTIEDVRKRSFAVYARLPLKPVLPAAVRPHVEAAERAAAAARSSRWEAEAAAAAYQRAVEIAPWSPELRYNLGLALRSGLASSLPWAVRELEYFIALAPADPRVPSARAHIAAARRLIDTIPAACRGAIITDGASGPPGSPFLVIAGREGC